MRSLGLALLLVACSPAPLPSELDAGGLDAGGLDAGGLDAGGLDAGGLDAGGLDAGGRWDIPLRVVREALGPVRVFCLARQGDAGVALLVDTGSQISFLSTPPGSPDGAPDAGVVWLGGRARVLRGRPISSSESIEGLPVVGFLGNDFFFEAPTELDLEAERLRRSDAPWDMAGWRPLPYDNRFDFMFVNVELEGHPVRLGFDTGAPHSLLLDAGPNPGDQAVASQDGFGNPITLYLGFAQLALPGEAGRTVPILRAPSFPSLEASNRLLGGPYVSGLFGLTSMGGRAVRVDAARATLWLR